MSYDTLGLSDAMLDSLSLQLREAEARKYDAERAHQVSGGRYQFIFISHSVLFVLFLIIIYVNFYV